MTAQPSQAQVTHQEMASAIRFLAMDAVEKAKSGHPGMPMGMADVATVLFGRFLKFDPTAPRWADRDRFVLSAGHGSMLLYALAYLTGYADVDIEQVKNFRQLGARTAGHPEFGHVAIADTTTGPLGQGITNAVGMALAEKMLAARYGKNAVDHYTYVIAGDGCLMEGVSQEAISMAGTWQLGKLIVLWDDNNICIDGDVTVANTEDQLKRFEAAGWDAVRVDGHDPEAVAQAIAAAKKSKKPSLIACRTIIGYGAPTKAGSEKTHGAPLGADEIAGARQKLGWPHAPFEVPAPVLKAWRAAGTFGASERAAWQARVAALPAKKQAEFDRTQSGELPAGWERKVLAFKKKISAEQPKWATRKASQEVLEVLTAAVPEMIGGSADLTHSNLTITKATKPVKDGDFSGRYIHYGVREHGMTAVMNGLALHGGFIPYGGTFLVFADYMRPAMRMAALMGQRAIYVLTHDSIGLGEDGPTHQPIETVASLRAMPNMTVFRPADPVETAECYALALANDKGPSVLALSRQNLPTVRTKHTRDNLSAKGAYVLAEAQGRRRATILATGSEVSLALDARDMLQAKGIGTAVVSMPSWELFERQDDKYRRKVLGNPKGVRVAVEALGTFGWERYVGADGAVIGMTGFGASGPAGDLYRHFGITAEAVVDAVTTRL